jgi:transcriptional regulator with PAS, ATPase and Fis domain
MSDALPPPPPPSSRFAWRTLFARSSSAVFVFGGDRRLRYANPAWERLTGESFAKLRGTRVSAVRRSLVPFAPPPEVWAGREARVRRPLPDASSGPPWWDFTFVPLLGGSDSARPLGVIGFLSVVGEVKPAVRVKVPAAVAAERTATAGRFTFDMLGGPTAIGERLVSQARAAAVGEVPVWIVGEPGGGKETLARVIHHNGPRRERAFVGLACGGVQPYLIDGMLFGKGGLASGPHVGTLYLKHPADLPRPLQDRILDWCESAFGPRLICGATTTAEALVKSAGLAPAFHTRYAALEVRVPPLRDRIDDLPKLLSRLCDTPVSADVVELLKTYPWPGNLRELADLTAAGPLTRDRLPRHLRELGLLTSAPPAPAKPPATLDELLEAVERRAILHALAVTNGQQTQAAERLGVFRARLWRRMTALGIPAPPQPPKPRKDTSDPE